MHRSTRFINRANTLWVVFSLFRPAAGTGCDAAAPDVSESSIITEVCNQTSPTSYSTCADQMTGYMQQSATDACDRFPGLFTDCLTANDDDHTLCADSLFRYQECHNYTMQAYAYCGCYYQIPSSLAACANEQLQPQPQDINTIPQTSMPVTAVPTSSNIPANATSADKEPTPGFPSVSPEAASSWSNQSTFTFSNPRISTIPRVRITSLKEIIPSSDLEIAWTTAAAPSTISEPIITIVLTHTTTFTAAGYTITATLTPPPIISTVYTCANDDDSGGHDEAIILSSPVSAAVSAPTILPPIAWAPVIGPRPVTPRPAVVVPAVGTEARENAEATIMTEHTGGSPVSASPSASVPAQFQTPDASTPDGTSEIPSESPVPSSPTTPLPTQAQSPDPNTAISPSKIPNESPNPSFPSTSVPTQAQRPDANTANEPSKTTSDNPTPSPPPPSVPTQAQGPDISTANTTTDTTNRTTETAIPSSSAVALSTALSEATAVKNASMVCATCRRKRVSRIFGGSV